MITIAEFAKSLCHDDVIKWKHFPRYWPFVEGIRWSPVNSPHNGQWRGTLMFSLICAWINGWVKNRQADDARFHCAYYDVMVMETFAMLWTACQESYAIYMRLSYCLKRYVLAVSVVCGKVCEATGTYNNPPPLEILCKNGATLLYTSVFSVLHVIVCIPQWQL